jgi:hypothetical protein
LGWFETSRSFRYIRRRDQAHGAAKDGKGFANEAQNRGKVLLFQRKLKARTFIKCIIMNTLRKTAALCSSERNLQLLCAVNSA